MTEDARWWVDEHGNDTCPCHARHAPLRCASCGERLVDHGGIEEPICPVDQEVCFEMDGARIHGNPNMSNESREAVRDVIAAAKRLMAETDEVALNGGSEAEGA